MNKLILSVILTLVVSVYYGQNHHLNLLSTIDYEALHNTELNDVWGYVDEDDNEYAIVGAAKGVSVVDVTDPANPSEVYWYQGTESVWRDLKVFGDHAYITTEADDGLLIIDLSPLPGGSVTNTSSYFGNGNNWSSAHNIYIDENGYGYIFGANRGEGGVIILDLFTDPMNPIEVGQFDNWYVHDGFVRNDIMYLAHVYDGFISIVDVTDKSNPSVLGTKDTPSSFAHNIWPSTDGNYVFTTDEVSDAYLAAYDVSDPSNITEVDRTQSSPGFGVVPHNAHVNGDFLVTSYYADGTIIHDISDPSNMVEVGRYDTYPGTSEFTTGNWGTYPFLPSGNIISTDIEYGFFVLGPDYDYAAKLEGQVTNDNNGNPIQGATVKIINDPQVETTSIIGDYKTGHAQGGVYDVAYEKYGYESQTISTTLTNGDTLIQDVSLVPLPDFGLTINVEDENGDPIIDADVRVEHTENSFDFVSNGLGQVQTVLYYVDDYQITAGKWGYRTNCITQLIDENTQVITLVLSEGIFDDFSFDFGWSETSDAESGRWERGVPIGEFVAGGFPNPNFDSPIDCGEYAFITDNRPGTEGNVSEGQVTLISPLFDLTGMIDPYVNYQRWFYNFHGAEPFNDTLRVVLSNGTDFVTIDKQGSDPALFDQWIAISKRVNDYITPTSTMQLFISTSDYQAHPNIVDAGFDLFEVSEGNIAGTEEMNINNVKVFPNPFSDKIMIRNVGDNEYGSIKLSNLQGQEIAIITSKSTSLVEVKIDQDIDKGIYMLQVGGRSMKLVKN
jgi:choice-of-anchor B domain-containing protein